jgi:hypothetical protein
MKTIKTSWREEMEEERAMYAEQIKRRKQEANGGKIKSFAKDLAGRGIAEMDIIQEDAKKENAEREFQKKVDALGESFKEARNAANEVVEHFQTRDIVEEPKDKWLNSFTDEAELNRYISENYKDISPEDIKKHLTFVEDNEIGLTRYMFQIELKPIQEVILQEDELEEKIERDDAEKLANVRRNLTN